MHDMMGAGIIGIIGMICILCSLRLFVFAFIELGRCSIKRCKQNRPSYQLLAPLLNFHQSGNPNRRRQKNSTMERNAEPRLALPNFMCT